MPRPLALFLVLALPGLAACSGGGASGEVVIRGEVHDIDGRPMAGATVVLVREADLGPAAVATLFTGTLGIQCLDDPPPGGCDQVPRTSTAEDGTYRFEVPSRQIRASDDRASTVYLSAGAEGGYAATARFQVHQATLSVPPIRLWAPQPRVAVGRVARVEWAGLEGSAAERVVFADRAGGEITWIAEGRSPLGVDARILEDSRGAAAVEGTASEEAGRTTFRTTHRSAWTPYSGTTGPAPSRGASCTPAPCAVTDGVFTPPDAPAGPTTEVVIDLGVNRSPSLIVVRGCPDSCNVETSLNRVTWTIAGSIDRPYFSVTPVAGPPVRFVRVTSTSDLAPLAEVSVWDR